MCCHAIVTVSEGLTFLVIATAFISALLTNKSIPSSSFIAGIFGQDDELRPVPQ